MCGFVGLINRKPGTDNALDRVRLASDLLEHRGPDDAGYFNHQATFLAFRRLSIIDTAGSAQPLLCTDERFVITFNGELYNFKKLKAKYLSDVKFKTKGDAEVALEMYKKFGPTCIEKFRGMFAFCVYDKCKNTLTLIRDQIGIKPLYYYSDNNVFLFASELKALKALINKTPSVRLDSLDEFLTYGHTVGTKTIFKGVNKLQPGQVLLLKDGMQHSIIKVSTHETECHNNNMSSRLTELLSESVDMQLEADVPVGAFLSGGVDSSLLVALMAKRIANFETFSIYFDGHNEIEKQSAADVAAQFGTNHTAIRYTPPNLDTIDSIVKQFDEPFADSSALPMYQLSEYASRTLKVVLSGDGIDELFGGYSRYQRFQSILKHKKLHSIIGIMSSGLGPFMSSHSNLYSKLNILSQSLSEMPVYWGLFNDRQRSDIYNQTTKQRLNGFRAEQTKLEILQHFGSYDQLNAFFNLDFATYLPDVVLKKVDITSMAHSLEVRVPFLDQDLVSFAQGIESNLKVSNNKTKLVYKNAIKNLLPESVIHQQKKGFGVPLDQVFGDQILHYLNDTISSNSVLNDYFDTRKLRKFFNQSNPVASGNKLWALIMLQKWLDQ